MSANDVAIYLKVFLTLALFGVVQQKGKFMLDVLYVLLAFPELNDLCRCGEKGIQPGVCLCLCQYMSIDNHLSFAPGLNVLSLLFKGKLNLKTLTIRSYIAFLRR